MRNKRRKCFAGHGRCARGGGQDDCCRSLARARPAGRVEPFAGRRNPRIAGAKRLGALQRRLGVVPLAPLDVDQANADERVGERRVPARRVEK